MILHILIQNYLVKHIPTSESKGIVQRLNTSCFGYTPLILSFIGERGQIVLVRVGVFRGMLSLYTICVIYYLPFSE